MDVGLETLLDPVGSDAFFASAWEREPLLISRDDPARYAGLFSLEDVDAVVSLSSSSTLIDDLRIARTVDGKFTSRPVETTGDGSVDMYPLYRAFHEGYTIIVNRVDSRSAPIGRLARRLEEQLHCRVGVNLYLTPQTAQGFTPHFDTHDVFVLQIHGQKIWRLYDSVPLPLPDDPVTGVAERIGAPRREVTISPGDFLYIPRGHVHEAVSSKTTSLHLTVGLYVYRWVDLIADALDQAAHVDIRLREAIPTAFIRSAELEQAMTSRFVELLNDLPASVDPGAAVRRFATRFFSVGRPVPDGHFVDLDRLPSVGSDTTVVRRPGMVCSVHVDGAEATIRFPGNAVTGPFFIAPALQYVAQAGRFKPSELPGPLNEDARQVLVKRLIREGLLAMTEPTREGVLA